MTPVERRAIGAKLMAHHGFIERTLVQYGMREETADAAQDVLLQAFRQWSTYDAAAGNLEPWLIGICRRVASNWRRTRQRRPAALWEPELLALIIEGKPSPEDAMVHALMVAFCRERIGPDHWRTLVAFAVEGVTIEALAEQEGVSYGAIEWRLHVARRELQAAILRYRAGETDHEAPPDEAMSPEHPCEPSERSRAPRRGTRGAT